mmetsp:Transcript_17162/g.24147  ORF Transcript_17162/g.24147 Transcript_17162/m.24147 type:complete len:589 (+) Transcript_17162:101-1867(+)
MPATKYTLFSSANAKQGEKPPCAFFASADGCRNGDKCKFAHVLPGAGDCIPVTRNRSMSSSSVVSTESEGEVHEPKAKKTGENIFAAPGEQVKKSPKAKAPQSQEKKKGKKRKNAEGDGNPFANPKSKSATPSNSQQAKKKQKRSEDPPKPAKGDFAAMAAMATPPPPSLLVQNSAKKSKSKSAKKAKVKQEETTPSYLNLKLPIAPFSLFSGTKVEKDSEPPQSDDDSSDISVPPGPAIPLPNSTATGRKWQKAIIQSREHNNYEGCFDFKKYIEADEECGRAKASDWFKAKPFGPWCASNPQAIAIDCEMCETRDPVTGVSDHKALCRVSIVNAEKPEEVLLDTLVKPEWPVVNYRTWVNGIKKEHLENVQFTLRHAQEFMMALCSDETVIAGHAVHNDLVALRMEHYCNVDSACLFDVKDAPDATISLKDLAMACLKTEMPKTHDSVNDARVALNCLEYYVQRDGKVDPIERTTPPRNRTNANQLFIHRIPRVCQPSHLQSMFLVHTSVQPKEVHDIEFAGDTGKTFVNFPSPRHANLAFDTLEGDEEPDKSGRMQKKVYLRDGNYVRVRKMVMPRENRDRRQST